MPRAAAACLEAGSDTRALSEYQKQDWGVEDGLPQGNVRTIVQDKSGVLLIGTGAGMATFDGLRFTPQKVDSKDAVANEPVNALLYARNGDLWIGTDGRGVIHRTAQGSKNVSEDAGLTQERDPMDGRGSQRRHLGGHAERSRADCRRPRGIPERARPGPGRRHRSVCRRRWRNVHRDGEGIVSLDSGDGETCDFWGIPNWEASQRRTPIRRARCGSAWSAAL